MRKWFKVRLYNIMLCIGYFVIDHLDDPDFGCMIYRFMHSRKEGIRKFEGNSYNKYDDTIPKLYWKIWYDEE